MIGESELCCRVRFTSAVNQVSFDGSKEISFLARVSHSCCSELPVAGDCALVLSVALLVANWNRGARVAEFLNVRCLILTAPALPRLLASKRFIGDKKNADNLWTHTDNQKNKLHIYQQKIDCVLWKTSEPKCTWSELVYDAERFKVAIKQQSSQEKDRNQD